MAGRVWRRSAGHSPACCWRGCCTCCCGSKWCRPQLALLALAMQALAMLAVLALVMLALLALLALVMLALLVLVMLALAMEEGDRRASLSGSSRGC